MPQHYYLPTRDYPGALPWNATNTQAQDIISAADLLTHWRDAREWWRVWMLGLFAPDVTSAMRALRVLCLAANDHPTEREDERTPTQGAAICAVESWLVGGPLNDAAVKAAWPDRHAWQNAEIAAGRDPRTGYGSLLQTMISNAERLQTAITPSIDKSLRQTTNGAVFRRMICRNICHDVAENLRRVNPRDLAPPNWPPSRLLDGDWPYDLPENI